MGDRMNLGWRTTPSNYTQFTYDIFGRPLSVTAPDGKTSSGGTSAASGADIATRILFTDDPLHGATEFPFNGAAVPIDHPFAELEVYDEDAPGMSSAQVIGAITRDIELTIVGARATMETPGGADTGNWVTKNLFRWGKGSWKGSGGKRWHLHLGPRRAIVADRMNP